MVQGTTVHASSPWWRVQHASYPRFRVQHADLHDAGYNTNLFMMQGTTHTIFMLQSTRHSRSRCREKSQPSLYYTVPYTSAPWRRVQHTPSLCYRVSYTPSPWYEDPALWLGWGWCWRPGSAWQSGRCAAGRCCKRESTSVMQAQHQPTTKDSWVTLVNT